MIKHLELLLQSNSKSAYCKMYDTWYIDVK